MFIYNIIDKKRKKIELHNDEIYFIVDQYVNKIMSDAQMSAFLMAVSINGMTDREVVSFTLAMRDSSEVLKFSQEIIDKHSTGGVSDSTTLVLVPILASLGVKVGKMSGRSLGFTGGTIDKLEVFEGYNAEMTLDRFEEIIGKINCSIISQTSNLAYADKLIYELRDKTATVESIPLIASSIMSKKLACGASYLLLNVHYGSGAFMKNEDDALILAELMVKIGNLSGVKTRALVSEMNTPLSSGVGCSLEVMCAIQSLNNTPSDLLDLSKYLSAVMLADSKGIDFADAMENVEHAITSGIALDKLAELVREHGGKDDIIFDTSLINANTSKTSVVSNEFGFIEKIDALTVAVVAKKLKELSKSNADKSSCGVWLRVAIGDKVSLLDEIAVVHHNGLDKEIDKIIDELRTAFVFSDKKVNKTSVIKKLI